ncbi:MAG TPA: hypothetical protein VHS52_07505 [Acidimicrobiales bacterium]|nr:hypothetical protein [Acidimicrobiales bacterium]
MRRSHETSQPWVRERSDWEPEPSPTGRAIIAAWLDQQLALISARRRRRRLWPH